MPVNTGKVDPIPTYTVAIEIQGIEVARFMEASGFDSKTQIIDHRETDKDGKIYINKVIGTTTWSDITLKRGLSGENNLLWEWRQSVLDGDYEAARKDGSITGYDPKGEIVVQYTFTRGWVSTWKGGSFTAKTGNVNAEEITITHEGLQRVK
ncbi:MAG TPA: phage tail protein [Chloroflexota bacterium]|nr:phage tail protein [Chloroflexota bacterium]